MIKTLYFLNNKKIERFLYGFFEKKSNYFHFVIDRKCVYNNTIYQFA